MKEHVKYHLFMLDYTQMPLDFGAIALGMKTATVETTEFARVLRQFAVTYADSSRELEESLLV